MILHLFSQSFFVNYFVEYLKNNYGNQDHKVVLYRQGNFGRDELNDDMVYRYKGKKDIFRLYHMMRKADRIVIHSLGVELEMLVLLYLFGSLNKKSVWIIWGSDLYWKREKKDDAVSNTIEHMRRKVISRLPYIGCLVTGDYELAVNWYKTNAKMIRVNYSEKEEKKILDAICSKEKKSDGIVDIVVGNSGTPSSGHIEIFDELIKWKDDNIRIHLPLAYGKKEYIEKVKQLYISGFGDKAVIEDRIVPLEDYLTMLSGMDIGIFNNDRQQALGNIFALMYMGKKVYLREGTSMWDELVDIQGAGLYNCKDITKEDFLTDRPSEGVKEKNRLVVDRLHYNDEILKEGWNKVFAV